MELLIFSNRLLDLVLTSIGLSCIWPIFVFIAVLIKFEDGGPIFFRQERVGHCGKPFRVWKFRTMIVGAERLGLPVTIGDDPRITKIGSILRKYKLDEFPQLFNVISGEMALVGPRPEVRKYVDLYTPAQRGVLDLRPGITDPASIRYRNESEILAQSDDSEKEYIEEIIPAKIALNLDYNERATTWSDFLVILNTLKILLKK